MAGHSHAKNVMHRKAAQGAKKAQAFGKLIREITVSAKIGLPDPAANPRLRAAVKAALTANMTRDTIDRAIKRAVTAGQGEDYEEVRYEGYGAHGIAIIAEALTDNRNRTASEVRAAFTKIGGNLGESGSVSYMFELKGLAVVDLSASGVSADDATLIAIDAGADDVVDNGDTLDIYTDFKQLITVRTKRIEAKLTVTSVEKTMRPKTLMQADATEALKALKLIDKLDDLDDVQKVYSNLDITDELAEQFSNS